MKLFSFFLFGVLNVSTAFARNDDLESLICRKSGQTLSAIVDSRRGDHPSLFGLLLNDTYDGAHEKFEQILMDSNTCEDLNGRALTGLGHALVCKGELFTPKGIVYGQVLLTRGSVEIFKELALEQGWRCSIRKIDRS